MVFLIYITLKAQKELTSELALANLHVIIYPSLPA